MSTSSSLNQAYKLVWSQLYNTWVVVSEIAKGKGKSKTIKLATALSAATLFGFAGQASAQPVEQPAACSTLINATNLLTATCVNAAGQNTAGSLSVLQNGSLNVTNSGNMTRSAGGATISVGQNGNLTFVNNEGATITSEGANDPIDQVISVLGVNVPNRGAVTITNSGQITKLGSATAIYIGESGAGGTGAVTITNQKTGLISGRSNGSAIEVRRASTITNHGTISSANFHAIVLQTGTGSTINNYGTISGGPGTYAINIATHFLASNHTFNIYEGSSFVGGINFNGKTGNTINFHTGSYTLPVANYLTAGNTINLLGTGKQLITSGLNGAGTGNIVVVAGQVATTAPATTQNTVATTSSVVSSVVNSITTPSLQGIAPDISPTDGLGTDVGSPDTSADRQAQRLKDRFLDNSFASLDTTAAASPLGIKQGHAFDKYGNLVWARAFASNRDMARTSSSAGSDNNIVGALVGYDRTLGDWRIGAYAGYGNGRASMNDSSGKMSTDLYMAGLYARHAFGEYVLLANLATGLMENRSHRYINLGAERATGTFTSYFIAPELAVSRSFALNETWSLTPTVRARYIAAFMPRYSESGSSQNVRYSADTTQMLEERIEFKLAKGFARPANNDQQDMLQSSIYGQVAGIATQRLTAGRLNANVLNTEFTVYDPHARDTLGTLVGVGFDHQFTSTLIGFGGYDATYFNDSSTTHTARLGLKMAF